MSFPYLVDHVARVVHLTREKGDPRGVRDGYGREIAECDSYRGDWVTASDMTRHHPARGREELAYTRCDECVQVVTHRWEQERMSNHG